jgi:hypothetical protein
MNNVNIRTSECAWFKAEIKILGRKVRGLRGFSFKKSVEKEHLYGSGNQPLDIQEGNVKYEGNIKLLGFEVDALNRAALEAGYSDLLDIPHEAVTITCTFQKTKLEKMVRFTAFGVAFTEMDNAMEQNAKMREITLSFIAMSIDTETI